MIPPMSGERPPEPPLGELLRCERLRRGLTVAQVAQRTRVAERHILALESGRLDGLPPRLYVRGFLEAYGALLGLDPETLLRARGGSAAELGEEERGPVFRRPPEERFNWRDWTIPMALAGGLALVAATHGLAGRGGGPQAEPSSVPTPAVRLAPAPPPLESAPAPGPPLEEVPGVRLLLRSEGSTWVSAALDGGEEKRYELGPGQNLELTARDRIGLALGDAGLVRIIYNQRELGFVGQKGAARHGLLFPAPRPGAAPRTGEPAPARREPEPSAGD
jgi:transcriptional regulator with XRE-family HTH domain